MIRYQYEQSRENNPINCYSPYPSALRKLTNDFHSILTVRDRFVISLFLTLFISFIEIQEQNKIILLIYKTYIYPQP